MRFRLKENSSILLTLKRFVPLCDSLKPCCTLFYCLFNSWVYLLFFVVPLPFMPFCFCRFYPSSSSGSFLFAFLITVYFTFFYSVLSGFYRFFMLIAFLLISVHPCLPPCLFFRSMFQTLSPLDFRPGIFLLNIQRLHIAFFIVTSEIL